MTQEQTEENALPPAAAAASSNGAAGDSPKVQITVDLPEGARVRVTVEVLDGQGEEADGAERSVFVSEPVHSGGGPVNITVPLPKGYRPAAPARPVRGAHVFDLLRARISAWPYSIGMTLFGLALLIYLSTRLIGLVDFPIYFFTDEAVQTVLASDLVQANFKDYDRVFLPTYFKNGSQYNLSASVYLQVIPSILFGKSVFVTRLPSVLVTLLAAISVALILKEIFHSPYWWSGALLLSITPAWFLHSRTAFETVLFVSLYAAMLYSYLLYRMRAAKYLYATVALGALAFYSYSPGQMVVAVTAVLLLISDAGYHWKNRETVLKGLVLAALLSIPYFRFRLTHPTAFVDHLRNLASYWIEPLPLQEKLKRYASQYLFGLSPGYWFVPNDADLARHLMKGYGHLLRWTLPFTLVGLVIALRELRSPAYRTVLIALLAAPSGAALAQIGITRTLVFVIPAVLLTGIGLSRVLVWIEHFKVSRLALTLGVFAVLTLANFAMLRDALQNGPTWYSDYGLGGLQYGARQLFGEIAETMRREPETRMIVSPTWANGTDILARFFIPDPLPFQMGSIEGHINAHLPLDDQTLFVMTPEEYEKAKTSGKFKDIDVVKTLPYPNSRPGFYFARLKYVDNIDAILEAERESRRALLDGVVRWQEQDVQLKYPHLDMGEPANAFDGDPDTMLRTLEANPAVFVLVFPHPVQAKELYLKFGATEANTLARVYSPGASEPQEFRAILKGSVEKPDGTIDFGSTVSIERLRLEVIDMRQAEPGHVHVWEVGLRGGQ